MVNKDGDGRMTAAKPISPGDHPASSPDDAGACGSRGTGYPLSPASARPALSGKVKAARKGARVRRRQAKARGLDPAQYGPNGSLRGTAEVAPVSIASILERIGRVKA